MAHEELKRQYAKDTEIHPRPWIAWLFNDGSGFKPLVFTPLWFHETAYRRHKHADLMLTHKLGDTYRVTSPGGKSEVTTWACPIWYEHLEITRLDPPATQDADSETSDDPHAELKQQYEKDVETFHEPHLLWEVRTCQNFSTCQATPVWDPDHSYRRKPEARPHAHLIKLWAEGSDIQILVNGDWVPCKNPSWIVTNRYRQKPATQTRFIPIYRMPAGAVYVGEGKISLEDCEPKNSFDTLISVLEIKVAKDNSTTLVKEHKCER